MSLHQGVHYVFTTRRALYLYNKARTMSLQQGAHYVFTTRRALCLYNKARTMSLHQGVHYVFTTRRALYLYNKARTMSLHQGAHYVFTTRRALYLYNKARTISLQQGVHYVFTTRRALCLYNKARTLSLQGAHYVFTTRRALYLYNKARIMSLQRGAHYIFTTRRALCLYNKARTISLQKMPCDKPHALAKNLFFKNILIIVFKISIHQNHGLTTSLETMFSSCHSVVDRSGFYEACLVDVCMCMGDRHCGCATVASYADQCSERGISVNWRTAQFCREFNLCCVHCTVYIHISLCSSSVVLYTLSLWLKSIFIINDYSIF